MGILSKTITRSKTNNKRLENKSPFERYLEKVEWVDIGHDVLYAKHDFPIEDGLFSLEDIEIISENLPKDIFIMNKNQYKWIQDNCKIIKYQDDEYKNSKITSSICCINEQLNECIHFNLPLNMSDQSITYYIKTITSTMDYAFLVEENQVGPKKFPSYLGTTKRKHVLKTDKDKKIYNIKIIKLK